MPWDNITHALYWFLLLLAAVSVAGAIIATMLYTPVSRFVAWWSCRQVLAQVPACLRGEADSFLGDTVYMTHVVETAALLAAVRLATARRIRAISGDELFAEVKRLTGNDDLDMLLMLGIREYCLEHHLLKRTGKGIHKFRFCHRVATASVYLKTDATFEELKTH
jgi:hypothetical protein